MPTSRLPAAGIRLPPTSSLMATPRRSTVKRVARRGGTGPGGYAAFIRARAARLLRPTLAFLAVWVLLGVIADRTGLTSGSSWQAALVVAALVMVPQLLWFVGIYLAVAAFAPTSRMVMLR